MIWDFLWSSLLSPIISWVVRFFWLGLLRIGQKINMQLAYCFKKHELPHDGYHRPQHDDDKAGIPEIGFDQSTRWDKLDRWFRIKIEALEKREKE